MKKMSRRSLLGLLSTSLVGWTLFPKLAFGREKIAFKSSLSGFYADPAKIRALGLTQHTMKISHKDAKEIKNFQLSSEWMNQENYSAIKNQYEISGKIVRQKTEVHGHDIVVKTEFDSPESMIQYYLNFSKTPGFFSWEKFSSRGYEISRTWS
jgi:hypothetical protein